MEGQESSALQENIEESKPFNTMKESIEKIIDDIILSKFNNIQYDQREGQKQCNEVSEEIIKKSQELSKAYKYSCTVIILQKGDSGFHMSASCFWDSKEDGIINKKYEFNTYFAIVSLFGIQRN